MLTDEQRHSYFNQLGFNVPKDGGERLSIARKWGRAASTQKHAIMLFDPKVDAKSSDWLYTLASIYNDPHSAFFNKKKAFVLYQEAAQRGHEGALKVFVDYYLLGDEDLGIPTGHGRNFKALVAKTSGEENFNKVWQNMHKDIWATVYTMLSLYVITKMHEPDGIAAALYFGKVLPKEIHSCPCPNCFDKFENVIKLANMPNALEGFLKCADFVSTDFYSARADTLEKLYHKIPHSELESFCTVLQMAKSCAEVFMDTGAAASLNAAYVFFSGKKTGIDPVAATRNTINYGLTYNKVDMRALPIIGEVSNRSYDGFSEHEIVEQGVGFVTAIDGTKDGYIGFRHAPSHLTLVFDEDIAVLEILSFCYDEHIFPDIGVPSYSKQPLYREKITDPSWLRYTQIGKTLYTTDVWAGELSWAINDFEKTEEGGGLVEKFEALRAKLNACDGDDDGMAGRLINVNPKKAYIKSDVHAEGVTINLAGMDIGIDGGFSSRDNELAWLYRNSDKYLHTRKTRVLTENFNDIAMFLPVFERLRQLMLVSYGLKALRDTGFTPHPHLMRDLHAVRKQYEAKSEADKTPDICWYLPVGLSL